MSWRRIKAEFKPGLIADDSELSAEGGYSDGSLVRFRQGRPEIVGGWEKLTEETFTGKARGGKAWTNLEGEPRLAFGTQDHLYVYSNGDLRDVTPKLTETILPDDPFTVSGTTVTVNHPGHGLKVGETVVFAQANPSGFDGTKTVVSVLSVDSYTFTQAALSTGGGKRVLASRNLPAGVLDQDDDPFTLPRTWSEDNFGETLLSLPSGRKLFAGVIGDTAPSNVVTNGTFATTADWAISADWTIDTGNNRALMSMAGGGPATLTVDGNLSQNIQGDVVANRAYRLQFTVAGAVGAFVNSTTAKMQIRVNTSDGVVNITSLFDLFNTNLSSGGTTTAGPLTYTVPFIMPAGPIDLIFHAEGSAVIGAGSGQFDFDLKSVSLTEIEVAPVDAAPTYSNAMFVDPNRFVVLLGTVQADGTFNPMCVRWSDQETFRTWVPDDDNLAGEIPLSQGGRLVAGLATRAQNVIFSDTALYTMQFTGSSGDVFRFDLKGTGCGLIGRHAAAELNGSVFWMSGNRNFYIFNGAIPQIIDCPVRAYVFDGLNEAQQDKIYAGINPAHSEVWWFYPRGEETEPSHYVCFNFIENHWSYGEMDRATWVAAGVFPYPIALNDAGVIYKQETGTEADGSAIDWHLTTGYFDIEDGGNIMAVSRYIPDFERHEADTTFNTTFNYKYSPNATPITFGPYSIADDTEQVNFRHSGRQVQIKWENVDCGFVRWGVQRFDVKKTGATR